MLRLVGSSVDITESRRVKEKLEASERKYRSIIENMNLGLVEWDSSGVVVFANKRFQELTKLQTGEKVLEGKDASTDLRTMLNKGRILHFREVTSEAFEVDLELKKSGKRSFLVRVAPVVDENEFTGYIAVFFDVTSIHS